MERFASLQIGDAVGAEVELNGDPVLEEIALADRAVFLAEDVNSESLVETNAKLIVPGAAADHLRQFNKRKQKVIALAAQQRVIALRSEKRVITNTGVQKGGARRLKKPVIENARHQNVIPGAGQDDVLPEQALDDVVAGACGDQVVALAALDLVVAFQIGNDAVSVAGSHRIVACAAKDRVVAVAAGDVVIPVTREDGVGGAFAAAAKDGVISSAGFDAIRPAPAVESVILVASQQGVIASIAR